MNTKVRKTWTIDSILNGLLSFEHLHDTHKKSVLFKIV